jgi:hypothetical protein
MNFERMVTSAMILAGLAGAQELSYEAYKAKVEPVFLKKREGHARCVVCHAESNNAFRLQALPAGAKVWTDEQSRKNYEMISQLVVPGKPEESRLTMHPLAQEAGGDLFHSGGRQFTTKNDPDWKAIADWIRGGN